MIRILKKINIPLEPTFPWYSLAVSLLFILLTPFINRWLVVVPFGIQLFRMLCYDEHIFMVDVVFLLPFSAIFMIPQVGTALGTLIVLGDILCVIRRRYFKLDPIMMTLIAIGLYLVLRMQQEVTTAIFMITGLAFLCFMLDGLDAEDAVRIVRALFAGLMIASLYGLIFRGSSQLVYYISRDVAASMEHQDIRRFSGLMADSNYYSVYLILAMVLVLEMYVVHAASLTEYVLSMLAISFFGVQTYSRTFFVMFLLGICVTICILFKARKYAVGFMLSVIVLVVAGLSLSGIISTFDVILSRFSSAKTLSDLTTGRSTLFIRYWEYIFSGLKVALIGTGMSAGILGEYGTHNLYLEILYFLGTAGLALFGICFWLLLVRTLERQKKGCGTGKRILSLIPVIFLLGTYFSLQGIKASAIYIQFFVAYAATMLPNLESESA